MAHENDQGSQAVSSAASAAAENTAPETTTQRKLGILVMGLTGSGKSSFIRAASGQDVPVGHGAESCTQACVLYQVKDVVCNTQFVLIDTPGYGDPKRDDVEILTMIRDCINSEECPSISGIVYFQRVTDTRMSSSSEVYNLGVVKTICGEKFYSHIVISTSMWDTLHPNIPAAHEKARERIQCLLNAPTGLGPLNKAGAVHMQFWGEDSSAQGILQLFASMGPAPRLAFQEQLAQNKPGVRKTDAGRFIGEETKRRAPEKMDEKRRQGAQDEDITSPRRDSKLSIGSA